MSLTTVRSAARLLIRARSTVISHPISTRADRFSYQQQQQQENSPVFPRHIRRQLAFGDNTAKKSSESSPSHEKHSKQPPKFRSKHYDPSKQNGRRQQQTSKSSSTEQLKLLGPHVLSQRLKKLCDANQIDAAVSMLKNSPLDAQNTPVWNTLIWEAMKVKRFKLAYSLYVDVSFLRSLFLSVRATFRLDLTNELFYLLDETTGPQPYNTNVSNHVQRQ